MVKPSFLKLGFYGVLSQNGYGRGAECLAEQFVSAVDRLTGRRFEQSVIRSWLDSEDGAMIAERMIQPLNDWCPFELVAKGVVKDLLKIKLDNDLAIDYEVPLGSSYVEGVLQILSEEFED